MLPLIPTNQANSHLYKLVIFSHIQQPTFFLSLLKVRLLKPLVNFAPTSFYFLPPISIGWCIDEEVNRMGEMKLKSPRISYGIPRSISLERDGGSDKPSHPPLEVVTMHPNFFTHGVRLFFPPFS